MKKKLDCIGVGAESDEVLRGNVAPYFSKGEVFLRVVRTISTACQVFIFNYFLIFFNKFFLKIFISFIFYFLLYFNIQDYKKSNVSCMPNYLTLPAGLLLMAASQPSCRRQISDS